MPAVPRHQEAHPSPKAPEGWAPCPSLRQARGLASAGNDDGKATDRPAHDALSVEHRGSAAKRDVAKITRVVRAHHECRASFSVAVNTAHQSPPRRRAESLPRQSPRQSPGETPLVTLARTLGNCLEDHGSTALAVQDHVGSETRYRSRHTRESPGDSLDRPSALGRLRRRKDTDSEALSSSFGCAGPSLRSPLTPPEHPAPSTPRSCPVQRVIAKLECDQAPEAERVNVKTS